MTTRAKIVAPAKTAALATVATKTAKTTTKTDNAKHIVREIAALVTDLTNETNQNAKKKIRAKLRRLGHFGASRTSDVGIINKIDATLYVAKRADAKPSDE